MTRSVCRQYSRREGCGHAARAPRSFGAGRSCDVLGRRRGGLIRRQCREAGAFHKPGERISVRPGAKAIHECRFDCDTHNTRMGPFAMRAAASVLAAEPHQNWRVAPVMDVAGALDFHGGRVTVDIDGTCEGRVLFCRKFEFPKVADAIGCYQKPRLHLPNKKVSHNCRRYVA